MENRVSFKRSAMSAGLPTSGPYNNGSPNPTNPLTGQVTPTLATAGGAVKRSRKTVSNAENIRQLEEATRLWWIIQNGEPGPEAVYIAATDFARTFDVKEGVTREWVDRLRQKWAWAAHTTWMEGPANDRPLMVPECTYTEKDTFCAEELVLLPRLMPDGRSRPPPGPSAPTSPGTLPADGELVDRLLVILCVNAAGTERLPPMVIGTSAMPPNIVSAVQRAGVVYKMASHSRAEPAFFQEWIEAIRLNVHGRRAENQRLRLALTGTPSHRLAVSWCRHHAEPVFNGTAPGYRVSVPAPRAMEIRFLPPSSSKPPAAGKTSPNPFASGISQSFLRSYRFLYLRTLITQQRQHVQQQQQNPDLPRVAPPQSLSWQEVLVLIGHVWYNELPAAVIQSAFKGSPVAPPQDEYVQRMRDLFTQTNSSLTVNEYVSMDHDLDPEPGIRASEIVEVVMKRRFATASTVSSPPVSSPGPTTTSLTRTSTSMNSDRPPSNSASLPPGSRSGRPPYAMNAALSQQRRSRTVMSAAVQQPMRPEVSISEAKKAIDNLVLFCSQWGGTDVGAALDESTVEGLAGHTTSLLKLRTRLDDLELEKILSGE